MLRVVTWNIFWGLGSTKGATSHIARSTRYLIGRTDRDTIPKLAEQLRTLRPDIVGLQEIDDGSRRNGKYSHVAAISKHIGLKNIIFAPDRLWRGYCADGNATLTKARMREQEIIGLPYRHERRNAIRCTIRYRRRIVDIYTTHLGAHRMNKQERIAQAAALNEQIRRSGRPALLIGDLNCGPGDEEFDVLCNQALQRPAAAAPSYPAYAPARRFDHILCTKHFKVHEYRTLDTHQSDHLPVFAVLELR